MRYSPMSVVLCLLFLTHAVLAQTTVSTIEGTIKDAQGHVVSGATVVVKSPSLGVERTATSDADGSYRITALAAGIYSLTVSHTGFATRTNVRAGSGIDSSGAAASLMPGVCDVRMVDLLLVPSNSGPVLVRRVTTNLLTGTTQQPYEEVICRGVRSFNVRYFNGSGWLDSWDSTQYENMAPTAVEVTVELQRPDADLVRVTRCTRVFLLSCSGLWAPDALATAAGGTAQ